MANFNNTRRSFADATRSTVSPLWLRAFAIAIALGGGMTIAGTDAKPHASLHSFSSVLHEVSSVHEVIVLASPDNRAMVAVCPALQGRVLTSSAEGADGLAFGWVNSELIRSRTVQPHFNAYGGEDRLWIGPEGGQFSVFFAPGAPFDLAHWNTPAPIDTEPFQLLNRSTTSVKLRKTFDLLNYSGNHFHVQIDREVTLLPIEYLRTELHLTPQSHLQVVGYESRNTLTNASSQQWTKKTGLLSLWILGQFQASPHATIVIPIRSGDDEALGRKVTADYFGEVPSDRLAVHQNAVFLKADAGFRAKLGISPKRTRGVVGSYDAASKVLTIVKFTTHDEAAQYVNSLWKIQEQPFQGDVANAYNDGPLAAGKPGLGHFYELESSSPAAELLPGDAMNHTQQTIHLVGSEEELEPVAQAILGVSLQEIKSSLPE
jgi:hypothetical protein